jgi:tetratricopeptide (TPR) repeat protein
MQDPREAVAAYRKSLRGCPDHPEAARWLYATHRLHVALNESVQAEAALKELLERYPQSEAAQMVRKGTSRAKTPAEPASTAEFQALSRAVELRQWREAIRLHQATVWSAAERAPADLLRALAVGGSEGRAAYADALRKVAAEHQGTPQAAAAQSYLVAISSLPTPEPAVNAENLKLFTPAPQAPHQVVILFPTGFDGNAVRNALARIHSTDFPEKPLGVRALPWNENLELLVVDGFKNAAEALSYRDAMRRNPDLRKMLPADRTSYLPVTVANFSHLYRSKDEAAYRAFVQRHYGSP